MRDVTVTDWKRCVYRAREVTGQTKVLLLWLTETMAADRTVSASQRRIADELGVTPRTVRGYIAQAEEAGLLSLVRKGQKGRAAAVYQGIFPPVMRGTSRTVTEPVMRGTSGAHNSAGRPAQSEPRNARDGVPPLQRRPTGDATSLTSTTCTPEDAPPSPEDEETYPEDADEASGGTPDDHRADGDAEVLDQSSNSGDGTRGAGSTPRPTVPIVAGLQEPRAHGARGHSTDVPPPNRSSRAAGRAQQLNSDDEERAS